MAICLAVFCLSVNLVPVVFFMAGNGFDVQAERDGRRWLYRLCANTVLLEVDGRFFFGNGFRPFRS